MNMRLIRAYRSSMVQVRATSQAGELKKLNQILDEMREDFSIETKGCISAARRLPAVQMRWTQ